MVVFLPLKFQKASSFQTEVYSCDFQRRWAAKQLFRSAISSINVSILVLWISNLLGGKNGFSFFPPEIEEPHLTKIGSHLFRANVEQLQNTEFLHFCPMAWALNYEIQTSYFIIQIQNTVFISLSQGVGSLPDGEE